MMMKIEKSIKVISFDVFDTLVMRILNPEDLYKCIEKYLVNTKSERFKNFAKNRVRAERQLKNKSDSYTLDEIYSGTEYSLEEQHELANVEREFEINNIVVKPEGKWIYREALDARKPIVCTSDMYLDSKTIQTILHNCGYDEITKIYVSCENRRTKRTGELFSVVCKDLKIGYKELLHIGDATRSDFLIPIEKGIHAKKISKRNGIRTKQEYYYQLGFSLFGVLVYVFCRWIHDQKDNKNLIFLAREGVFLSECYHELFPEDQFEILYVSREAVSKGVALTALKNKNCRDVSEVLEFQKRETVEKFIKRIGADNAEIENKLYNEKVKKEDSIKEKLEEILQCFGDNLMESVSEYHEVFQKYLCQVLKEENIFVDIGWKGSMQEMISQYLMRNQMDYRISGLYMGIMDTNEKKGYWFNDNKQICQYVLNFSGLIEILFMPCHGTTKGYKINDNGIVVPILGESEFSKESQKLIKEFQRGVLEFITRNKKIYKVYKEMNHYERNIIKFGNDVGKAEIENLGQLEFYDNGKTMKLVEKVSIWNPKQFLGAFSESKWKTAFLKRNIKIPLPYGCIVAALRQIMENSTSKRI